MKQFEGIINGKCYTNYDEFNKALSLLEDTDNINVSYKYVTQCCCCCLVAELCTTKL